MSTAIDRITEEDRETKWSRESKPGSYLAFSLKKGWDTKEAWMASNAHSSTCRYHVDADDDEIEVYPFFYKRTAMAALKELREANPGRTFTLWRYGR